MKLWGQLSRNSCKINLKKKKREKDAACFQYWLPGRWSQSAARRFHLHLCTNRLPAAVFLRVTLRGNGCGSRLWDGNSVSAGRAALTRPPHCNNWTFLLSSDSSLTGRIRRCGRPVREAYVYWDEPEPKRSRNAMRILVFLWLRIKSTCISSFTKIKV